MSAFDIFFLARKRPRGCIAALPSARETITSEDPVDKSFTTFLLSIYISLRHYPAGCSFQQRFHERFDNITDTFPLCSTSILIIFIDRRLEVRVIVPRRGLQRRCDGNPTVSPSPSRDFAILATLAVALDADGERSRGDPADGRRRNGEIPVGIVRDGTSARRYARTTSRPFRQFAERSVGAGRHDCLVTGRRQPRCRRGRRGEGRKGTRVSGACTRPTCIYTTHYNALHAAHRPAGDPARLAALARRRNAGDALVTYPPRSCRHRPANCAPTCRLVRRPAGCRVLRALLFLRRYSTH